MFNPGEYVRSVCSEKGIAIAKVEKDCGFANGYLNPKKLKKLPYDRAVMLSNYLNVPLYTLLGEEAQKENPTAAKGSEVLEGAGYYKLNKENKKLIDQMIAQLIKSQSGD